jgi:hypothetical protein
MNSHLLAELAWLFKVESVHENHRGRGDGGEAMRLFCISLELDERAMKQRRKELCDFIMGEADDAT